MCKQYETHYFTSISHFWREPESRSTGTPASYNKWIDGTWVLVTSSNKMALRALIAQDCPWMWIDNMNLRMMELSETGGAVI